MWPFRFATHRKRGLRMMVVTILSEGPKNGVELMDGVEAMTRGWWRPTPGSIYPLLSQMTDEGTIKKAEAGRYELTASAKREYHATFRFRGRPSGGVNEVLDEIKSLVTYAEDLKEVESADLGGRDEELRTLGDRIANLGKPKKE